MPELPEIEVLRRSLQPLVQGARIASIRVWNRHLREPVSKRRLESRSKGREIVALRRRAKYLLLDLSGGETLVIHLGMSGRLTVAAARTPAEQHEHLAFHLDSGKKLRFRDPRRFGLVLSIPTASLAEDRHFSHLGVEPLGDEFRGATLAQLARGRRGPVKGFLMNARVIAGLGNIYASEALYRAGIHPRRSVARISSQRWDRLAVSIRETLEDAIRQGGTTLNDFANASGQQGYFQVSLSVYDREGEPCNRCGRAIRRIDQGGRSTFYCVRCQR